MGYIMITSRCNMTCAHCCVSAFPGMGQDMDMDTYRQAVRTLADYGETLTLGGGEPTMHPQFWEMLGYAMGHFESEYIFVATNGSNTETALALANMAKKGVISVALSQDQYHDPSLVDPTVIQAFSRDPYPRDPRMFDGPHDMREIRNVEERGNPVAAVGRGTRIEGSEERCSCDVLSVRPDGNVFLCGHYRYAVGHVREERLVLPEDLYDWGEQCSEWGFRNGMLDSRTRKVSCA